MRLFHMVINGRQARKGRAMAALRSAALWAQDLVARPDVHAALVGAVNEVLVDPEVRSGERLSP